MIAEFEIKLVGFNRDIKLGNIFVGNGLDKKKHKYVVIRVGNIEFTSSYYYGNNPVVKCNILAQRVDVPSHLNREKYVSTAFTERYNAVKKMKSDNSEKEFRKVGDFLKNNNGWWQITEVSDIHYELVDLFVTYEVQMIHEWNISEINDAVKQDRRKNFKIIG